MAKRESTKSKGAMLSATIDEVEDLAPRVRRIRLSGDSLIGIRWSAGQKIKIRAGSKKRSYTPARVDPVAGWMDIVFFLHGNGPASQWASTASVGEKVEFVGPVKSIGGTNKVPDWAMFLGDETALGLAAALLEALPPSVQVVGAIEVDEVDASAVQAFGVPLSVALRTDTHGDALLRWFNEADLPKGKGMVWLSGEAISVRALKRALAKRDLPRVKCKTKAYWSCKGHTHRKSLQL